MRNKSKTSSKRRSHGKRAWTGSIGSTQVKQAAVEMDRPYVAVVLKSNSERTRSTYRTADEAFAHAQNKIGEIARTQGGTSLQFAICKVVEIVEATSPTVFRRAPKRGDGTAYLESPRAFQVLFDELFSSAATPVVGGIRKKKISCSNQKSLLHS